MKNAECQNRTDYTWIGKRLIGHYTNHLEGPLLIAMGAIHGNEPAGVRALELVFKELKGSNLVIGGEVIGLIGNLQALSQQRRYLSKDLNRQWTNDRVSYIKKEKKESLEDEDKEQKELMELLDKITSNGAKKRRVILLDLHTTSASGAAYSIATSTGKSRQLAESLGVPVILGLEDEIEGTTLNYFSRMGLESFCFEAGQHYAENSVERTVAAIWQMLVSVGCLIPPTKSFLNKRTKLLKNLGRELPKTVRFKYRRSIQPNDQFRMREGFANFERVKKGELLAFDKNGAIRAEFDAIMLMPLYQSQGRDGFFLAEEI